eukprot:4344348-Pleurochrysis_carterae.AAC.1
MNAHSLAPSLNHAHEYAPVCESNGPGTEQPHVRDRAAIRTVSPAALVPRVSVCGAMKGFGRRLKARAAKAKRLAARVVLGVSRLKRPPTQGGPKK